MISTLRHNIPVLVVVISIFVAVGAAAQQDPTGFYVMDSGEKFVNLPTTNNGHVTTVGAAQQLFPETDIFFGFDIARDIELVQDETGFVTGYYMLDGFGGQHEVGTLPAYQRQYKPYFGWDIARDLEVVNSFELMTDAVTGQVVGSKVTEQIGYYIMDGYGGIHPVNETVDLPYRRGSSNPFFKIFHDYPSAYPPPYNYPYLIGYDIMRDLEVSYVFTIVTDENSEKVVGQTNGYYMLDGFGAVHNCRTDLNETPILAPWENLSRPYFSWDIARDFELTPRGDGYYLLDGMGGVHTVNASLEFGPGVPNVPPYVGFDIFKDIELVQGVNGSVIGYYVLTGQGVIYTLGNAPDLGQVVTVPGSEDLFRDLEVSPLFTPITFAVGGPLPKGHQK